MNAVHPQPVDLWVETPVVIGVMRTTIVEADVSGDAKVDSALDGTPAAPNYASATARAIRITSPVTAGIAQLERGSSQLPLSGRLSLLNMFTTPNPLTLETLGFTGGSAIGAIAAGSLLWCNRLAIPGKRCLSGWR
jgi:hypothetical protein